MGWGGAPRGAPGPGGPPSASAPRPPPVPPPVQPSSACVRLSRSAGGGGRRWGSRAGAGRAGAGVGARRGEGWRRRFRGAQASPLRASCAARLCKAVSLGWRACLTPSPTRSLSREAAGEIAGRFSLPGEPTRTPPPGGRRMEAPPARAGPPRPRPPPRSRPPQRGAPPFTKRSWAPQTAGGATGSPPPPERCP